MKKNILIYSILFVICASNCVSKTPRLHNPPSPKDAEKQAVFGFGYYKYNSGILGNSFDYNASFTIVEVVSVDEKANKIVTNPFLPETPVLIKEGSEEVHYSNVTNLDHYYTFLTLDATKKYALTNISWKESCGRGCWVSYSYNFPIPDSLKLLPIKLNPGEIKFGGIYKFTPQTEAKKVELERGEQTIIDGKFQSLKSGFFTGGFNEKGAERKFLNDFIELQTNGYWKEKAQARLAQLGK